MEGLSVADVSAMTRNNGILEGDGLIILILFFLMFGGGAMFNGRGCDTATTAQLYEVNNQQNMTNALAGIKEAVCSNTYENARLMDNGFSNITNQLTALGYQMSQCCCDLKTQMLQDKYDDTRYQLEQANTAVANAVQTQNILNALGRYYAYPPVNPYVVYGNGTTIS